MRALRVERLRRLVEVTTVEDGGGKAATLARLARAGFPVPDGYVVSGPVGEPGARKLLLALGGRVAVRSSINLEDGRANSFAGLFRSFLNVRCPEKLGTAVRDCLESAGDRRVRVYCRARGIDPDGLRPRVLVQRMIDADVAGVLFTVHPTRGREDEMLVEACSGTAHDLVGGRITGETTLVISGVAAQASELLGTRLEVLLEAARRIERTEGSPQDIEWAFEGGRLWILQARPITGFSFDGIRGEWTTADFRDGGVASSTVSPLMWSLYGGAWQIALNGFLREIRLSDREFPAGKVLFGRPYWNLGEVKRCAARLPGYLESEFDRDVGIATAPGAGQSTPVTPWRILRALPTLIAVRRVSARQEARAERLLAGGVPARFADDPASLSEPELRSRFAALVTAFYTPLEVAYFRTIFCVSIAKIGLQSVLENTDVSTARLLGGLEGLSHLDCAQGLWELANGTNGDLGAFLDAHGYHARRELDLRGPRWSEEPGLVLQMASGFVGAAEPGLAAGRRKAEMERELARAMKLMGPLRRRRLRKRLERVRRLLRSREELRDLCLRTYARIRAYALEVGRRAALRGNLGVPDDIFHLRFESALETLDDDRCVEASLAREQLRRFVKFEPPGEIGGRPAPVAPPSGIRGVGGSAGRAAGPARVVRDPKDAGRLGSGAILVCPYSDPGWTPLLGQVAGVITETGGILSHAAVICREFGIPAVLGVSGATGRIPDGAMVKIDGGAGHVELA